MSERKHYNPDQKVVILRELLENRVPISQLAEKYGAHPNDIYNWKKKLFESAENIFTAKPTDGVSSSIAEKKISKLEETLRKREERSWITMSYFYRKARKVFLSGLFLFMHSFQRRRGGSTNQLPH